MLVRERAAERWSPADVSWKDDVLLVKGLGRVWEVPIREGRSCVPGSGHDALVALAARMDAEGFELRCCCGCVQFRCSGMSCEAYPMGTVGYCGKAERDWVNEARGHRGCGEFEYNPLWRGNLSTAQEGRRRAWRGTPTTERLNAFEGCILGLAVGDAIGFAAEFRRRQQILDSFGSDGLTGMVAVHDPRWPPRPIVAGTRHPPGTFSDDTQMTIALAEGLLEAGTVDLDAAMEAVGRRFVAWSRSPKNDRAPGLTCISGCRRLETGLPWREAGVAESKGCGAAMRVAPIGLLLAHDRSRLLEFARASSLLTHGHPAALDAAAAVALLVALALHKTSPDRMYEKLIQLPDSPDFSACLARLPEMLKAEPAVALSAEGLGEGWVAEEAVVSALYCFSRSPDSFETTVLTAANTDGDSDSIACIAGSISGAFNGAAAIPEEWRTTLEESVALGGLGRRLWEAACSGAKAK